MAKRSSELQVLNTNIGMADFDALAERVSTSTNKHMSKPLLSRATSTAVCCSLVGTPSAWVSLGPPAGSRFDTSFHHYPYWTGWNTLCP